jgi:hypothetical protein
MIVQYAWTLGMLGMGSLPEFIIIGAQKGGTTSLYRYLLSHSQILGAKMKELHFFSANYHRGLWWYKACFPTHAQRMQQSRAIGMPVITGEASPNYLFHTDTPQLLAKALPDVKLIALIRNPVDRLISHYHHMIRIGRETLPLKEAIVLDEERLSSSTKALPANSQLNPAFKSATFSYLARGRYIEQLERYANYFNRDQMLILKSENFFVNTQIEYNKVLDFLEVGPHILRNLEIANRGTYDKKEPYTEVKQELREYFRPYNERLSNFLEEDFNW